MYSRLTATVLGWARVTQKPDPPAGAPGSVRTFRAGRNYYYIRLLRWGATQIGAAIGIVFSIGFTTAMTQGFDRAMTPRPAGVASPSPSPPLAPTPPGIKPAVTATPERAASEISAAPPPSPTASPSRRRNRDRASGDEVLRRLASRMPKGVVSLFTNWFVPFLLFLEFFGIATFLLSLPFTYALARLEFEQHWYIVTDRSLRIRTGVLSLSESTMSFANLQQVEVKQGPFQRLLGLADVRVRSAGGGDGSGDHEGEAMHTGVLHSVENADEIRDLILARLRAFREAGLGDPDRPPEVPSSEASGIPAETLEAAREVLRQARALRAATVPIGDDLGIP